MVMSRMIINIPAQSTVNAIHLVSFFASGTAVPSVVRLTISKTDRGGTRNSSPGHR
jgi:hypothetical protein